MWLRKILVGFFDIELEVTCIFCDNQSYLKLFMNLVCHDNSKHIEIRYHDIMDVLTKPISRVKFDYFSDKLGVSQFGVPQKRE